MKERSSWHQSMVIYGNLIEAMKDESFELYKREWFTNLTWVGKVTWGINGVTGEAWLTATRYLWDIGSMWISRWESATLEDRTRSTSLWTVTMYGRPLKNAAGSARPRRVSLWCG